MTFTTLCRKAVSAAILAGATLALPASVLAQDYPSKPITIIAPAGPGSLVDILARLVGDGMVETWGQQVVVKNVGGAGGSIGTAQLAKADPDGYTLGFVPGQPDHAAVSLRPQL